ncbi:hypothetical protein LCGC14_0357750 [marine sediment metagenome]|uniref:Uncharacterized protein n=1 Tax=marine sediment metagenome TaxID=412755 RepID=A0A0F9T8U5_9ZZZZ
MSVAHHCEVCDKPEYDDAPHNHKKPSEGRIPSVEEMEGTQLQHDISDEEFKILNKPAKEPRFADTEIDCTVSGYDGDITKLQAAKLIIDRQAEEIARYTKTNVELMRERDTLAEQITRLENGQEFANDLYAEMKQTIVDLNKKADTFMAKYDEQDAENVKQAEQLKAKDEELEEWRNNEAAVCPEDVGFVEYIAALNGRLKAKDDAIKAVLTTIELPPDIELTLELALKG